MKTLRILYDNAADRAILTASSQAGTLGPANLQREESLWYCAQPALR